MKCLKIWLKCLLLLDFYLLNYVISLKHIYRIYVFVYMTAYVSCICIIHDNIYISCISIRIHDNVCIVNTYTCQHMYRVYVYVLHDNICIVHLRVYDKKVLCNVFLLCSFLRIHTKSS